MKSPDVGKKTFISFLSSWEVLLPSLKLPPFHETLRNWALEICKAWFRGFGQPGDYFGMSQGP